MKVMSLGGALYFNTFMDNFSRRTMVNFLRFKNKKFKKFKALAKKQTRKLLKIFRSNHGEEYTSL
jgi:hypothetical protein